MGNKRIPREHRQQKQSHIPNSAPIRTDLHEPDAVEHPAIRFDEYLVNRCQIKDLNKKSAKNALTEFKKICRADGVASQTLTNAGVKLKSTHNNGNYQFLFNGLTPDVHIFHVDLSGKSRVFFYFVGMNCFIRAILNDHL